MPFPHVPSTAEVDFALQVLAAGNPYDVLDLLFDQVSEFVPVNQHPTIAAMKAEIKLLEKREGTLNDELYVAREQLDLLDEIGATVTQKSGTDIDNLVRVLSRCVVDFRVEPTAGNAARVLAGLLAWGSQAGMHWSRLVNEADRLNGRLETVTAKPEAAWVAIIGPMVGFDNRNTAAFTAAAKLVESADRFPVSCWTGGERDHTFLAARALSVCTSAVLLPGANRDPIGPALASLARAAGLSVQTLDEFLLGADALGEAWCPEDTALLWAMAGYVPGDGYGRRVRGGTVELLLSSADDYPGGQTAWNASTATLC